MADYSKQIATTSRLIAKKGQAMVFVQVIETKDRDRINGGYKVEKKYFSCMGLKTSPKSREITAGFYSTDNLIVLIAGDAISKPDIIDLMQFDDH